VNEILTYVECFKKYPDQWILLEAVTRDETNKALITGKVIHTSYSKQEVIDKSRSLKKVGVDVAVVCTIETLDEALSFVYFDNGLKQQEYITPEEYAFMFNLYYGLTYPEYVE
jgi:hypothetical protein